MLKIIVSLLFIISLLGCSSMTPKQVVTTRTQTVVIDVPAYMLLKPTVPVPPDKDLYLSMSDQEKENALTDYIIHLLTTTNVYSLRLDSISAYITRQKESIAKANKDAAK